MTYGDLRRIGKGAGITIATERPCGLLKIGPVVEDTNNSKTNALFIAKSHEMWASAADEPQHDQDNRDNQENVNEPSHRRRGHQAQQPENDEDDGYSF